MTNTTTWTTRAEAAKAARDNSIPAEYALPKSAYPLPKDRSQLVLTADLLSQREKEIVQLSATALRDAIAAGTYSAVETTRAYCKATAIAHQATECLVELFEPEALERAQWLDDEFKRTGKVTGPLHGVPMSVKEHVSVKGHDSASGMLATVGKLIATEDALMVKAFRDAGSVFYTHTTTPQALMHLETDSYLGVTTNPYNPALSSGGSSGGEGAILGMKGAPWGIGSDIGGSIRGPSGFCGIYGFKPTGHRLPLHGFNAPHAVKGAEGIVPTGGPMTRSIEDIKLWMEVCLAGKPWLFEPEVTNKEWNFVPKPWEGKLRIGVMRDDGVCRPVAPVNRALDDAIAKLKATGAVEIVPFTCFKSADAWDILSQLYWPDGGEKLRELIEEAGEPELPLTTWVLDAAPKAPTLSGHFDLCYRRDVWRAEFAKHWQDAGVDVVLSPVYPLPAPPHNTAKYLSYTSYWNMANYPGGVFPTGLFVDPAVDAQDPQLQPRNDTEAAVWANYDAQTSVGAPISLQLTGYAGADEFTLAAMEEVVRLLG